MEIKMGFFSKIISGLQKTRTSIVESFNSVLNRFTKIDEELFEELEETLIMSDMGVETSVEICDRLRKKVKENGITDPYSLSVHNQRTSPDWSRARSG